MLKLYDFALSGNCYKARLMLSLLNLEYKIVPLDLKSGEHKSLEFLRLNLFGQIPVLVDGNTVIRDSQAILVYLVQRGGNTSTVYNDLFTAKIISKKKEQACEVPNRFQYC